ncbi:hypothetical protein BK704_01245 [[Bacillus thuringiensis] serovar konkukian]|nr:DUF3967 domain-containing protein [Bacillus thuringiensis]MED1304183.1 DUF3967 domain-containing protein [Bacillus pacificus]OUB18350.1 hypothetical protein BK704_01245 [[Bacillus thuringiensis] serovar konkukian]
MNTEWYTVKDIEEQLNISKPTIYRYLENHGHYLKTRKVDNAIFIANSSVIVLKNIREQYENGKRKNQVEEYLKDGGIPLHVAHPDNNVRMHATQESDELQQLVEASTKFVIFALEEKFKQQMQEYDKTMRMLKEDYNRDLQSLTEQIQDARTEIQNLQREETNRDNDRDQKLMETIRSIQELKKMMIEEQQARLKLAATQEKKPWWRFW